MRNSFAKKSVPECCVAEVTHNKAGKTTKKEEYWPGKAGRLLSQDTLLSGTGSAAGNYAMKSTGSSDKKKDLIGGRGKPC